MAKHLKKHAGRHVVRTLIAFLLLVLLVGGVYYALLRQENSLTEKLVKAAATLTPEPTAQATDTPAPTASPLPTDASVPTDEPQSTQSVPVQPSATGEPTPIVNLTESPTQPATSAPTDAPTSAPTVEITPEATAEPEQAPAAEPVELDFPYYIEVDRGQHVVRVYTVDENGEYSILARTMICTTDMYANKPGDGLYRMDGQKMRWGSSLLGENQFQYATRICGKLLFHSINYSLQYPDMIKPESYATLGTAGSEGSVLLLAADAKWIYDNVPAGTPVRFLSTEPDSALLASLAAPALGKSGYDPTDPRDSNPDYDPAYEESKPEVTPYPGVTPAPTDSWEFRTYP